MTGSRTQLSSGPGWFRLPCVGTFLAQCLSSGSQDGCNKSDPYFLPALNPREAEQESFRSQNLVISHCVLESGLCVHFQADHCDRGDALWWRFRLIRAHSCSQGVEKGHPTQTTWVRTGKSNFPTKVRALLFRGADGDWQQMSTTEGYYRNPHITVEKTKIPKG